MLQWTCTIMLQDPNNILYAHEIRIQNEIEIVVANFNFNTRITIHVVVYKPSTTHIEKFL